MRTTTTSVTSDAKDTRAAVQLHGRRNENAPRHVCESSITAAAADSRVAVLPKNTPANAYSAGLVASPRVSARAGWRADGRMHKVLDRCHIFAAADCLVTGAVLSIPSFFFTVFFFAVTG